MSDLATYLASKKAASLAWVAEDPTARCALYPVQEVSFWHKMGIVTESDMIHYELATEVYEQTKAVYGYKPSWASVNAMSDKELLKSLTSLGEAFVAQEKWEAEWDEKHQADIEYQNSLTEAEGAVQIEGELQFTEGYWNVGRCTI